MCAICPSGAQSKTVKNLQSTSFVHSSTSMDPDFTGIICLPHKGKDVERPTFSGVSLPLKSDRNCSFKKTSNSNFKDKEHIWSVPNCTGQFNERPNTTTLPLTFSLMCLPPSRSVLQSSWSHEINGEPAVLDRPMYVCDSPSLPRVRVHVLERMSTQQGLGELHTISCPSIQTFSQRQE